MHNELTHLSWGLHSCDWEFGQPWTNSFVFEVRISKSNPCSKNTSKWGKGLVSSGICSSSSLLFVTFLWHWLPHKPQRRIFPVPGLTVDKDVFYIKCFCLFFSKNTPMDIVVKGQIQLHPSSALVWTDAAHSGSARCCFVDSRHGLMMLQVRFYSDVPSTTPCVSINIAQKTMHHHICVS